MRYFFCLFILITFSICNTNAQEYTIEGIIEEYPEQTIYIADFYGDQHKIIDSTGINENGFFTFLFDEDKPAGIYRIIMKNNNFFDIIFNKENVRIITKANDPVQNLEIINSIENKLYYDYLNKKGLISYKIDLIQPVVRYYPDEDNYYKITKEKFIFIQNDLNDYIDSITSNHPNLFVTEIIKNEKEPFLNPDYSPFEQNMYSRVHYFDDVDFSDTTLLRSDVFSSKILGYLSLYQNNNLTKDQLENRFIQAVDTILKKTRVNQQVFEFTLNYLIGGFEHYGFNKVLEYIADNSDFEESCEYTGKKSKLQQRIETLKRLATGKQAPDFSAFDLDSNLITLSEIDNEYTLLLFWASWCPHCKEILPEFKKFADNHEELVTISISVDTSKTDYLEFIEKGNYDWINICDYKGWDNYIAETYGIYATPTLLLLDNDRTIIAKPTNVYELKRALNKEKQH